MQKIKLTSRGIGVAVHAELQASFFRDNGQLKSGKEKEKTILKQSNVDKAHHQASSIAKQGTGEEEPINR